MLKTKKLIIFGLEDFAQIAYEYFSFDSEYEVVAFTVNRDYVTKDSLFGLPVVPFEELTEKFSPDDHFLYAAITYGKLNEVRQKICNQVKEKGYKLASYISSKAFVWKNVTLGEHVFIFENNTIQPFAAIGNNVVLWSGNHIGHHSKIADNCFISSHVVLSGWTRVGHNSFIGVNSAIANNINIGSECWIGHNSTISKDIPDLSITKVDSVEIKPLNKESLFKILSLHSKKRN